MGQVLHECARTIEALWRATQGSEVSIVALARRYDLNPKTVQKWKKCPHVHDMPMEPKERCSTTITAEEEAITHS